MRDEDFRRRSDRYENLDFELEGSSSAGPIYVPSSYDNLVEFWLETMGPAMTSNQHNKNKSDGGNISQVTTFLL